MSITHQDALKALDVCLKKAEELGVIIGFAIVDENANTILMMRMDGAQEPWLPEDSRGKAMATALNRGTPSGKLQERATSPMLVWLNDNYGGKLNYLRGGVPVRRDGKLIGAIACGGAPLAVDEAIAAAGASAIGDPYVVEA